jgi:hypothetical protein
MTDTQKIDALTAEVAELRAELAAERREREALKNELDAVKALLLPSAVENKRGLETLEQNFGLTMQFYDSRLGDLTARLKNAGGGDSSEILTEFTREILGAIDYAHGAALGATRQLIEHAGEKIIEQLVSLIAALTVRVVVLERAAGLPVQRAE